MQWEWVLESIICKTPVCQPSNCAHTDAYANTDSDTHTHIHTHTDTSPHTQVHTHTHTHIRRHTLCHLKPTSAQGLTRRESSTAHTLSPRTWGGNHPATLPSTRKQPKRIWRPPTREASTAKWRVWHPWDDCREWEQYACNHLSTALSLTESLQPLFRRFLHSRLLLPTASRSSSSAFLLPGGSMGAPRVDNG